MRRYKGSLFDFSAGAQIIDMMLLVIDVTKGIQTQTAEVNCIISTNSLALVIVRAHKSILTTCAFPQLTPSVKMLEAFRMKYVCLFL
jgi:selenocysteine-specific translation elongation factor